MGIQIDDIDYPEIQKAINITYQGKSVRLDVYVEDDKRSIYNAEFALEDETTRIFFNTKGNLEEAPEELREFLQYIETNQPESTFTKQLDHEVKRAKQNEKWR